jgi:glycosyltransferase involved in cell wall biosynthesis
MRVVVLLAYRNEERVLGRTLEHLYLQGVETYLIDHGSTDRSLSIARSFLGRGVFHIEQQPYAGNFNLPEQMALKERIAARIDADWFIHQDADEIREAPRRFATLAEGIAEMDRQGYNAIDFEEFIFLPTSDTERHEGTDFVAGMRHYYHFRPQPLHRLNAWKNTGQPVDLHTHSGHRVVFAGRRIAPEMFRLRHYIALSRAHALAKYCARIHSPEEIRNLGWDDMRVGFRPEKLRFPRPEQLKLLGRDEDWDTSDPCTEQTFLGGKPPKRSAAANPRAKSPPETGPQSGEPTPRKPSAPEPPMPIIVGVARSGTTLLRLMLDSHPQLAIPQETHFLPDLRKLQQCPDLKGEENSDARREEFLRIVTGCFSWKDFGLEESVLRAAVTDPKKSFNVAKATRRFYQLCARARGKERWGDKTPPYVWRLRDVAGLLPEAHFIHIIRDGRDVALSARGLWFGSSQGSIEDAAANWLWRISQARQQSAFCAHYLEVRYEELISRPRVALETICGYIGLDYDPAMENYHLAAAERLSEEIHDHHDANGNLLATKAQREAIFEQTQRPPNPERVGRWRKEMSAEDRERFESVAGGLLRELGYEVDLSAKADVNTAPRVLSAW